MDKTRVKVRRPRSNLTSREIPLSDGENVRLRLESLYWLSLEEIATREGCTISFIVECLLRSVPSRAFLSAACRTHVVSYFRAAASDTVDHRLSVMDNAIEDAVYSFDEFGMYAGNRTVN